MLFSVLIYDSEEELDALPDSEHARRLDVHHAFQAPLRDSKTLGGVVKLMPSTAAITLRGGPIEDAVIDGPFAETKEQLIGFYLIRCETLEEAIETARGLPRESGSLEIRPIEFFEGGDFTDGAPLVLRGDPIG